MRQVTAYEAFAIFGDYDSNAPDTCTVCYANSEELAKQICAALNKNPRAYTVVFVDGWEHAKRFSYRPELIEKEDEAVTSVTEAIAFLAECGYDDGEE